MPLKVARLLPGRGLDLSYVDDRALEGATPLRSCDNVRLVDAEWWIREGELALRRGIFTTLPFEVAVSLDLMYGNTATRRHFLIGRAGVLEVAVEAGTYAITVPYTASWTGTLGVSGGSNVASFTTSTGVAANAHIVYGLDSDGVRTAHYVVSRTATHFTFDRPYAGTSGAYVSSGFVSTTNNATFRPKHPNKVSFTVFRQRTAYASGDIWGGAGVPTEPWGVDVSYAVTAGSIWLVWTPGVTAAAGVTLPAIRLDATAHIVGNFMRKTQANWFLGTTVDATAFNNNDVPLFVTTYKDRLMVVRADENNANDDRTVWYSKPGDMMLWHTGTAAGTPAATHNVIRFTEGLDPITAVDSFGDSLVYHRRASQQLLRSTGSETFPPGPFAITRNDQGIGCVAQRTLINVRGLHYFLSEYGPMTFDGQRVVPLNEGIMRAARNLRLTAEWSNDTSWPEAYHAIYHRSRQQIWWSLQNTLTFDHWSEVDESADYTQRYLIYDIDTGEVTLSRYLLGYSGGTWRRLSDGMEFVVRIRSDGTVCQATQTGRAKDSGVQPDDGAMEPPCYMETPWLNFGVETEKFITRIEIELRGFGDESSYQNDLTTDVSFSGTNVFRYTLEVQTDLDAMNLGVNQTFEVEKAELAALLGSSDGLRGTPRVLIIPKVQIQGNLFKLRLRNTGVANWRPLRVSQVLLYYEERTAYRREKVA